jgi:hypothetical protein
MASPTTLHIRHFLQSCCTTGLDVGSFADRRDNIPFLPLKVILLLFYCSKYNKKGLIISSDL